MPSTSYLVRTTAFIIVTALLFSCAEAGAVETSARQALVMDYNTGTVLFEKNADELMAPSSMSKLMTVYVAFSHLKDGTLGLSDRMTVSKEAWAKYYKSEASLMFLPVNAQPTVEELLRGIIIQSGNDACTVLAEGIAGSEDAFAREETEEARKLGLRLSTFKNASGWPDPEHKMTARELATLARRLISDFPEYYGVFAERSFTYNRIKQDNRNPLIWQNIAGADGMKTGHTQEGGFGVTGTALRDGRRVIVVLNGLPSNKARAAESAKMLEWAFREFDDYTLFKAGEAVSEADVWLGKAATVPLVADHDITVTFPRVARHALKAKVSLDMPVPAPVIRGTQLGMLTVSAPGNTPVEIPLVAGKHVERLEGLDRIRAALSYVIWGSNG